MKKTSAFFETKGIADSRLNAELIFAHVFQCKRLDLYLRFERPVSDGEKNRLRPLVARRATREPLQYILGDVEFMGLLLSVDARALIPRPETEELVDRIIGLLPDSKKICELGTGTGCIAIALAHHLPEAELIAVDQSPQACELARSNVQKHNLGERVKICQSNWFDALGGAQFDLIVSNPPYLTEEEWESAEPEVKDFEPQSALIGSDTDASGCLRHIIASAPQYLKKGACLALETGIAQHENLSEWAQQHGFERVESAQDLQGRDRFIFAYL